MISSHSTTVTVFNENNIEVVEHESPDSSSVSISDTLNIQN